MIEATVIYDRGTHLVVMPKNLEPGTVVEAGPPRNIKAVVIRRDLPDPDGENDGLMMCEVLPEFSPPDEPREPLPHDCFGGYMGIKSEPKAQATTSQLPTIREESDRARKAAGLDPLPPTPREAGQDLPVF
jgi:hypothetical protein